MFDTKRIAVINDEHYLVEYDSTHPVVTLAETFGVLDKCILDAVTEFVDKDIDEVNKNASFLKFTKMEVL